MIIHATAGVIHPRYQGILTFELSNLGPVPLKLYPLMKIAQIIFIKGEGNIDTDIQGSQYSLSVKSKVPSPEKDYDCRILKKIKESK